jgi:hypothetical protein
MATYPNKNYSLIYMWLAIALTGCLLFAGSRFIQPAFNKVMGDLNLRAFEKIFQGVEHPPGTETLASRSELGDFSSDPKGCTLFMGEIRRYEGNIDRILAAYEGQDVKGHPLQVIFLEKNHVLSGLGEPIPSSLADLEGWSLWADIDPGTLYLVYLLVMEDEGSVKFNCP